MNGHAMDRFGKDLIKIFKEFSPSITVTTNLTPSDILDAILILYAGKYYLYRKSNEETVYTHKSSNYPAAVIRNLVRGINNRVSNLLANREIFNSVFPATWMLWLGAGLPRSSLMWTTPKHSLVTLK